MESLCNWEEKSKIDFNFYDSKKDIVSNIGLGNLLEILSVVKDKMVINGGHYIPNLLDQNQIGKNSIEEWKTACCLTTFLNTKKDEVFLSILINDLPFSEQERKEIITNTPLPYQNIMADFCLSEKNLIFDSIRKTNYTEKRLANRLPKQLKRGMQKFKGTYSKDMLKNYCITAIIAYLEDIRDQGVKTSVFILPKCCHQNTIEAVRVFKNLRNDIRIFVFFETSNCII